MMDEEFLDRIDGPFIHLTTAILYHSLRCWLTGNFINNLPFTRANGGGKIYNAYSREVTGRLTITQGLWNVGYRLEII